MVTPAARRSVVAHAVEPGRERAAGVPDSRRRSIEPPPPVTPSGDADLRERIVRWRKNGGGSGIDVFHSAAASRRALGPQSHLSAPPGGRFEREETPVASARDGDAGADPGGAPVT